MTGTANRPGSLTRPASSPQRWPQSNRPSDAFLARHDAVEDEVQAAFLDGYGQGLRDANLLMAQAMEEAIGGPHAYGMELSPLTARETVQRLVRALEREGWPEISGREHAERMREHDQKTIALGEHVAGRHHLCVPYAYCSAVNS